MEKNKGGLGFEGIMGHEIMTHLRALHHYVTENVEKTKEDYLRVFMK